MFKDGPHLVRRLPFVCLMPSMAGTNHEKPAARMLNGGGVVGDGLVQIAHLAVGEAAEVVGGGVLGIGPQRNEKSTIASAASPLTSWA